jgi:hypothetical protein
VSRGYLRMSPSRDSCVAGGNEKRLPRVGLILSLNGNTIHPGGTMRRRNGVFWSGCSPSRAGIRQRCSHHLPVWYLCLFFSTFNGTRIAELLRVREEAKKYFHIWSGQLQLSHPCGSSPSRPLCPSLCHTPPRTRNFSPSYLDDSTGSHIMGSGIDLETAT